VELYIQSPIRLRGIQGKTDCLLPIDTTRTAEKTKNIGATHRRQDDLKSRLLFFSK
jgi:hypothetical protein